MPSLSPLDPERLFTTLARHKVRYVLIGAVAARLQGFPRLTADTDTTPERGGDNLKRLAAALRELKARVYTESVPEGLPFDSSPETLGRAELWNLVTSAGRPAPAGARRRVVPLLRRPRPRREPPRHHSLQGSGRPAAGSAGRDPPPGNDPKGNDPNMIRMPRRAALAALLLATPAAAQEPVDQAAIGRIRDEGQNRSHVAETFDHLTNVIGPRLTGSPAFKQAVDWSTELLRSYGLADVHQESWPFGRGWSLEKLTLEMVEPRYAPLIGYAEAWTPSTRGELLATPVYIGDLPDSAAVVAQSSKLRGATIPAPPPQTDLIPGARLQPSEHDEPVPIGAPPFLNAKGPLSGRSLAAVMRAVGAGVVLRPTQGAHGTVFVMGNRATPSDAAPSIVLAAEHYNLIVRALLAGAAVKLRVRVDSRYHSADTSGYNVIAEIPGTDPAL